MAKKGATKTGEYPALTIDNSKITSAVGVHVQLQEEIPNSNPEYLRELRKRATAHGYGLMKELLVDEITHLSPKVLREAILGGVVIKDKPVLSIQMPCAEKVVYQTLDDIPEESTPCSCGDTKHWFIQYQDLRSSK